MRSRSFSPSACTLGNPSLSQSPQQDNPVHTVIGTLDIEAHETEDFALNPRIVNPFD